MTAEELDGLLMLWSDCNGPSKVQSMKDGKAINATEERSVLHHALRADRSASYKDCDGNDVVAEVWGVLDRIKDFSDRVRNGEWVGATGKKLTDVVAIGIGGSYLGPEFICEALRTEPSAKKAADGRRLRFLANVDPIDVSRATDGLNPETTLVVVVSKTFTTAETMLNARTMRRWITDALGNDAVGKHVVAVSTNSEKVTGFGVEEQNMFGFWNWVGGRYSVCSAVGVLPLSLQYGFDIVLKFLEGARAMDDHFFSASPEKNLPVIMGLIGVWNSTYLGFSTRALLPYCQALLKLAPHIQQVDMESNGKRVKIDGSELQHEAGPINFGEPGTNGQHSFYQLMHQGRVVPADFIGFKESQNPIELEGENVSNHDELMSNFFAQPDALAIGKTAEECRAEGIPEELVPHKVFKGNRPSSSLLMQRLDAYELGRLLALFEHRTAVEGFVWDINSFDQWGVELGKVLATQVRTQLSKSRKEGGSISGFNPSTTALMKRYLA
eukprot:Plantae.Rhodophyta-Purpureofilum_apyrenoidigerum.ctg9612.p1 GENE.Plantae.Rhodophyta-Purpureofilum_apyrenoidigerum.ctg9612~~Plantae.Rhodophyta-Purpureofilum_apyrenoidigerum.ctg9612.p1  ORF type:complete len:546 (+),score=104.96 Plantae.Rhodophyta-Purpureofilum_apyrenoidigerum.ctg9612:145-1638(+)